MSAVPPTADLCDAHPDVAVCEPIFQEYGGRATFAGPIATLKVFEDNALVRAALEGEGRGRVLVVDGGGSLRCALVGGNLGALAVEHGWSGLVVFGCVRDTAELAVHDVGIRALAAHPRRSRKGSHGGLRDVPVTFAGVTFRPAEWLYADHDGIVVSTTQLRSR